MKVRLDEKVEPGATIETKEYYISASGESWNNIAISLPSAKVDIELGLGEVSAMCKKLTSAAHNMEAEIQRASADMKASTKE